MLHVCLSGTLPKLRQTEQLSANITTTAELEQITSGEISIGDTIVTLVYYDTQTDLLIFDRSKMGLEIGTSTIKKPLPHLGKNND